jgi:hypothetical protein
METRCRDPGIRLPGEMHVFLAERALKQRIETERPGLHIEFISERDDLLTSIAAVKPHVLHFFCHGSAEFGNYLELATLADMDEGAAVGSILFEARDFEPPDIRKSLWLTTLNACNAAPERRAAAAYAPRSPSAFGRRVCASDRCRHGEHRGVRRWSLLAK